MRMCITGYVGDPSFEEVLRTIMEGSKRLTLFVHDGRTEKVLHFSRSEVWALVRHLLEIVDKKEYERFPAERKAIS